MPLPGPAQIFHTPPIPRFAGPEDVSPGALGGALWLFVRSWLVLNTTSTLEGYVEDGICH